MIDSLLFGALIVAATAVAVLLVFWLFHAAACTPRRPCIWCQLVLGKQDAW